MYTAPAHGEKRASPPREGDTSPGMVDGARTPLVATDRAHQNIGGNTAEFNNPVNTHKSTESSA